jgi:WD40-like Beta Propeller Repeat
MRLYLTNKSLQLRFSREIFLIICCISMFLASCAPNISTAQPPSKTSITSTTVSATPTSTTNPLLTAQTTTRIDCPASGVARSASMPPDTTPAQPAVFYLAEIGGVQTGLRAKDLKRYDLATGKTATIFSFPNFTNVISNQSVVSLSPDKHWLLIASVTGSQNSMETYQLQLMQTDGTQLQTLLCAPSVSTPLWSPDGRRVAFQRTRDTTPVPSTDIVILDLTTGRMEQVETGAEMPEAWLDKTRLYVAPGPNTPNDLYLLDTSKGANQPDGSLPYITSINKAPCGAFEPGHDATQLYTASCMRVMLNNCQSGEGLQGPGTISVQPATGGKATTIYNSPSHAIVAMHVVDPQTILFYIENSAGDLSLNGLWKINTNGSDLTPLTTVVGQRCFDSYPAYWPQIASNSQSYAQLINTFTPTETGQAIQIGSLTGGTPITIATPDPAVHPGMLLVLVGMA